MYRYELRAARDEDRDWAYELKRDAYREVVERQFGGPWDDGRQRFLFDEKWEPSISQIISVDDEDVGLIAIKDQSDHVWIDEIQIISSWRGRGIGTAVLLGALADAKGSGKPVRLRVLRENHGAKRLYEKLSFSYVGSTETHDLMERVFTTDRR